MFGKKEEMTEDTFVKTLKNTDGNAHGPGKGKARRTGKNVHLPRNARHTTACAKDAGEGLYCAHGTSFHCIAKANGCLCPGCPVTKQLGLKYQAYCLAGSEKSQRFDAMIKVNGIIYYCSF